MFIKLLIKDLMLRSKVKEWASRAGVTNIYFFRSPEEVPSALTDCNHLIIDLNLVQGSLDSLIKSIREVAPETKITGFGSHVDKELHSEAKSLGLDAVLPRSKFFGDLGRWLS
jgi:DNA-binding NarL/FixJ family response regulator